MKVLKPVAALAVAAVALFASPAARAQVPALPALPAPPPLPPQLVSTIEQAEDVLIPVVVQAATAAYPVVNAAGIPLRPACFESWVTVLVFAETASELPSGVTSPMVRPLYVVCGAATSPGPGDAVFQQVDDAAGDQLASAVQPVLDQAQSGLAPARPNLAQACGAIGIAGKPNWFVPPPMSRFDVTRVVCGH